MECLSFCLAEKINLTDIEHIARAQAGYVIEKHWQVLELIDVLQNKCCYIFANGTLVSWNFKRNELDSFFAWIKQQGDSVLEEPLFDGFSYRIADETKIVPHDFFNVDCLTLEEDDNELKLGLSYGFSQSIKLNYYERRVETLIGKYNPLMRELSKKGQLKLSRSKLRKIIGDIMVVKGEISLTADFLYQPKFFWQHPNLEMYFDMLESYLDIAKRTETLLQQLSMLNEIFDMCNSYLENKHSYNLEIIIIVLIAVEILFNVLNLHLR